MVDGIVARFNVSQPLVAKRQVAAPLVNGLEPDP